MDTGNTALPRGSPGLAKSTNDLHDAAKNSAFQQAQELENLDKLQDRLLEAVGIASQTLRQLSNPEEFEEEEVQKAYQSYLALMREVHEGLASRAAWVKNYVPYRRNTKGLRREVRIKEMRVAWLKEEARRWGYKDEEARGKEEGIGRPGGAKTPSGKESESDSREAPGRPRLWAFAGGFGVASHECGSAAFFSFVD
ncbi:hypothetical protein NSK_001247 [Nannochloropsis salina CCMP1776]|uniref:Uncharacterized protein n=1 Tax=Nannochloropsis salina CCMP1776 TaxID=1027361 RepID=A0A4D9D866_9STRA|nr:hypothetical protein NSK_001247 [Nannochloropsis salina CCMP1776]|eukprot:TFJ87901.1 hypothetical protein NSK_001247 [Nannochloropsis salina CCMP1776]